MGQIKGFCSFHTFCDEVNFRVFSVSMGPVSKPTARLLNHQPARRYGFPRAAFYTCVALCSIAATPSHFGALLIGYLFFLFPEKSALAGGLGRGVSAVVHYRRYRAIDTFLSLRHSFSELLTRIKLAIKIYRKNIGMARFTPYESLRPCINSCF